MKLLTLSQLRFFRLAPWSTLTVLLGVTLAVSSIVAVHQISQRVVVSLAAVTPVHMAGVTHRLSRPNPQAVDDTGDPGHRGSGFERQLFRGDAGDLAVHRQPSVRGTEN